jgi:hypothetical protein
VKPRPIILRGPYPTVEDTARLLGVSDRRVKELLRLVRSNDRLKAKKNGSGSEQAESKISPTKRKRLTNKRIVSASRKRRARGKTAKAHA